MNLRDGIKYLLLLFVALIPLSKTWILPVFGTAVQPSELLFVLLIMFLMIWDYNFLFQSLKEFSGIPSLLILLCSTVVLSIWHFDFNALTGGGATIYLIGMSLLLSAFWKRFPGWRNRALFTYVAGCALLAITALYGGILKWGWGPAGDLALTQQLPGGIWIHRLTGFTETPTMLGMTLTPALIFLWFPQTGRKLGALRIAAVVLIGLAWLGSFSKTHAFFLVVLLFFYGMRTGVLSRKIAGLGSSLLILLLSLCFLHFYPLGNDRSVDSPLIVEKSIGQIGDRTIYPTTYVLSHLQSWKSGRNHFWTGAGPGSMGTSSQINAEWDPSWRNALLKHQPLDAHNLWLGAFATMGILGLLAVGYFTVRVLRWAVRRINQQDPIVLTTVLVLLFWMTEGLVTDVLHFRPGWFFLSFALASVEEC